jgi:hypothetical protein
MTNSLKISNYHIDIVNGTYEKIDENINGLPALINEHGVLFSYSGMYWKLEKDEKEIANSLDGAEWGKLMMGQ